MFGLSRQELRFGLVISSSHFVQHFLSRLIPPLIPVMAVVLAYPFWQLGLLISLYSFGSGLAQAPLGVLSDRYDRLYILPTGITIAGLAYVLFGLAPVLGAGLPPVPVLGHTFEGPFVVMCAAMLLVGIGAAVTHPTGYPMITDNAAEENKGKLLGAFGSSAKFGDAAAPAVIAGLVLVLVWNQIILLLGLAGAVVGILLFLVLRRDEFETVPRAQRVPTARRDDASEAKLSESLEDTSASSRSRFEGDRRRYLYPILIIYLFFMAKKFTGDGVKTFIPAFIVGVYAYSFSVLGTELTPESVANLYFAAFLLFAAIVQLWIGGLADRFDPRHVLLGGVMLATGGMLALSLLTLGPIFLLMALFAVGAGVWGLAPARDRMISDISPPEREGRTFGYIWTAIGLTGSAMPAIVGYVMDVTGMRQGFFILTIGTVLAAGTISLLYLDSVYTTEPEQDVSSDVSTTD